MRRILVSLLVVAGVAIGVPGTRLVVDDLRASHGQEELRARLASVGAPQPVRGRRGTPVASGSRTGLPFVTLRIPRFGDEWEWAVVEGTDETALALGPGHYPGTPLPGARGNVGIAAHRAGHGSPFLDFDKLREGDEVLLTQSGTTWVYRIASAPEIVAADAHQVLDPLPGRMLTLTTCWPKYGSSKRMVVRGELARVTGAGSAPVASL